MIEKFQAGEVVQLRSGGPALTVTDSNQSLTGVLYWNGVSGLYEKFSTVTACLKPCGAQVPQAPESAAILRNNLIPKSSLS